LGERGRRERAGKSNVVPLARDPGFFFERAVRFFELGLYRRALKEIARARERDPKNAMFWCKEAEILYEMGNYEESNQILKHLVERIDPSMTECYLYMTYNFVCMEDLEGAEWALMRYLETDAEGRFADEVSEIMEWIGLRARRSGFPAPVRGSGLGEDSDHVRAQSLLDDGRYEEAVRLLRRLVRKKPEFLPARNNLAMAYYSMGRFREAERVAREVLKRDPGNLHALCNLAVFFFTQGKRKSLDRLLGALRRVVPFREDQLFKLASTFGILGEHEAAYGLFRRLLRREGMANDSCLLHYTAVSAYNTGRRAEAKRYWRKAAELDPDAETTRFYLKALADPSIDLPPFLKYHYRLPLEVLTAQTLTSRCTAIGRLPVWLNDWQAVLELADFRMRARYGPAQRDEMAKLWIGFLSAVYPDVPKISKPDAWAAALEYWTAKLHRLPATYRDVAEIYGVPAASVGRFVRLIGKACGLSLRGRGLFEEDRR